MKRGVYAGSFDPVTNGHLWMINKAVDLFDELIVAVGYNPDKHYTFCADERAAMLRESSAVVSTPPMVTSAVRQPSDPTGRNVQRLTRCPKVSSAAFP